MVIFSRLLMCAPLLLMASCVTSTTLGPPPIKVSQLVKNSKGAVLFWWASQCPCVSRYESRILDLHRRMTPLGINFYAISSNSDDENKDRTLALANLRNFRLPFLMDEKGALAQALNVRTTPTVVLVDSNGTVRFRGWIDNERYEGERGRTPYLEDAINQLVEGKEVTQPSSPTYGCRITKRLS